MKFFTGTVASPIGDVTYITNENAIIAMDFSEFTDRILLKLRKQFGDYSLTQQENMLGAREALNRYFAGDVTALDILPVELCGTAFQNSVWQALRAIPAGETWDYDQLGQYLGKKSSARAVGHANSQNPLALILPCHRVIRRDKGLGGYAGGLHRKEWLLAHERAHSTQIAA